MRYTHMLRALATLPLLFWVSGAPISAAPIAVEQVIAELQPQTDLPIWVPDEVPEMEEVYISFYTAPDAYSIYFDYVPDCGGATACNYGSFMAEQNGQFLTIDDLNPTVRQGMPQDKIVPIRFENGMSGQFVNTCGAYCMARVQWRLGGILYSAVIKNGTQEATVELANIVLQGEERRSGRS
ncbi:hypothetical protein PN498_22595 [Oscillatoria sp. CS-180]|uniref:hypothetical protein n=1 Tax=Oscillatoria sp. CS-180 TaxID=3021720 RepID=UPI00232D0CF6|nr:hypothetical protein [Oscillatoria sp. CS-180]MDB9528799.1 hypothetical protein [Oscillatoria sp. CS-180]